MGLRMIVMQDTPEHGVQVLLVVLHVSPDPQSSVDEHAAPLTPYA